MKGEGATIDALLGELEVFFGAASDAEASVYAQLPHTQLPAGDNEREEWKLAGTVTGPYCQYAHTLPSSVALRDLGSGETHLAEVRVPDPCFWTPEMPYTYLVDVELRRGDDVLATQKRTLAIRRLGVDGRWLYLDAKRWVPRAAVVDAATLPDVDEFRAAALGLEIDDPSDDFCARATREGVLLAARVTDDHDDVFETVRRLATQGAVGFVIVENPPVADELKRVARNVILCQHHSDADESPPDQWAEAIVYDIQDIARAVEFANACALPVIACRRAQSAESPAELRAACDALQRDLAQHGDFAGYFV